jgi:hypothetical protein
VQIKALGVQIKAFEFARSVADAKRPRSGCFNAPPGTASRQRGKKAWTLAGSNGPVFYVRMTSGRIFDLPLFPGCELEKYPYTI